MAPMAISHLHTSVEYNDLIVLIPFQFWNLTKEKPLRSRLLSRSFKNNQYVLELYLFSSNILINI